MLRLFVLLVIAIVLTSCEYHTVSNTPEPVEPDTARSYVSAIVTAPGMNSVLWEVRTPDTLSKGSVPATGPYAGTIVRENAVQSLIFAINITKSSTNDNYFRLEIRKPSHLSSRDFTDQNNRVDALRSWDEEILKFLFITPPTITVPFVPDTLRDFGWSQLKWEEQYLPNGTKSNPNLWSVFDLSGYVTNVRYSLYGKAADKTEDSRVERVSLIIDGYDLVKRRVSGRFSFRVIGAVNKEIIDIKDGKFENVRF